MSTGNFGTIRGADVSPNDVEIFVHYTPSRANTAKVVLTKLDPNQVLVKVDNPNNATGSEIFGGMYTLKLPTTTFGKGGG